MILKRKRHPKRHHKRLFRQFYGTIKYYKQLFILFTPHFNSLHAIENEKKLFSNNHAPLYASKFYRNPLSKPTVQINKNPACAVDRGRA